MTIPLDPGSLALKDPSSIEPFGFDWTEWLAEIDAAETVTSSAWVIRGADDLLLVDSDSIVAGNLLTQCILSGGTVGLKYTVTNAIVTSSSFEDQRSFFVKVKER